MPSFRKILHDSTDESATGRAYRSLKNDILTCRLAPGDRIFEGEISESLEMSKTPVREALGMLVHEGFVDVQPRQGYQVTEITLADVQEVYQLRLLLEPAAAELAAQHASPEQLQSLRALLEFPEGSTHEEKVLHGTRFHGVMADASGNGRLAATLHNLLEEMQRLQFLGLNLEDDITSHMAEHRELLDALLKGNHHVARDISARQIETGRMKVLEAILESLTGNDGTAGRVTLRPASR